MTLILLATLALARIQLVFLATSTSWRHPCLCWTPCTNGLFPCQSQDKKWKKYKQVSWKFSNEHFPFLKINFYFRQVAYMEEQVGKTWLDLLLCNLFLPIITQAIYRTSCLMTFFDCSKLLYVPQKSHVVALIHLWWHLPERRKLFTHQLLNSDTSLLRTQQVDSKLRA